MKVKFKPGPTAAARSSSTGFAGFDGFDGMKRTCTRYKLVSVKGAGQARQQLRCADYKKGAGKPPCVGSGRKVKARSPGLLRGSLQKPDACGRAGGKKRK